MDKILISLFLLLIVSCSGSDEQGEGSKITGKVIYPAKGYIYLELLTADGYETVDSTLLDSDQSFELKTKKNSPDIYRINLFKKQKFTFPLGNEDVLLELDKTTFFGKGNDEIESLSKALQLQNTFDLQASVLREQMQTAYTQQDSGLFIDLQNQLLKQSNEFQTELKQLVRRQNGNLTAVLLLRDYFPIEPNLDFYDEQIPVLSSNVGDSFYFNDLLEKYQNTKKLALGSVAPDFSLPDPDGKMISLSDLRGEYIFLDFWASWCTPCRMENPDLVRVYEEFKDDGFDILGVSFDKTKENWLGAVKKDGLDWHHVSDLKYFDSALIALYNIEGIPMTFLLDPDGVIIAKNIHSEELRSMLTEKLNVAN